MILVVCSASTMEYAKKFGDNLYKVDKPPTKSILDMRIRANEIIAIGGGAVMDTAKILAAVSDVQRILCYPTTAAGAGFTSRAVYWDGTRKHSIRTPKPITIVELAYSNNLPRTIVGNTECDAISHALESLWSANSSFISRKLAYEALNNLCDRNRLIEAGNLAGMAIEITGTNLIHGASYPLTGFYKISHGHAVGIMLPVITKFMGTKIGFPARIVPEMDYDIKLLAEEAITYEQIHTSIKNVTIHDMQRLYAEALA